MDLSELVDGPLPDVLLPEHVLAVEDAPNDPPLQVELRTDSDDVSMQVESLEGETDVDFDMASSFGSSRASARSLRCIESDREGSSCGSEPLPVVESEVIPRQRSAKIATAKFFRRKAVEVQAQVLLVNAVDMAMRIPKALLSQAYRHVSAAHAHGNIVYAFLAKLVGLAPRRLSDLFSRVRDNGWEPCQENAVRIAVSATIGSPLATIGSPLKMR